MAVFFYIALALLMLYLFLRRDNRKHKHIPGPKGLPLVGYAPYMKKGKEHEIFSEFAGQYGDIVELTVFGQTLIVLNSAPMIRAAFSDEKYKKYMNDGAATFYGEYILFGSQSIGFMNKAYGSDHNDLRKALTRGLHVYGEGRQVYEDKVMYELVNLLKRVETIQQTSDAGFDMLAVLKRSLTNLVSIILGGHDLKDDDPDVNMFWHFDEGNDFFLGADVNSIMTPFPFLRFVPGMYKRYFEKIQQAKETIIKRFYEEKKATYKQGEVRGLVDFLIEEQLEAQKAGDKVLFTDEKIMAMVLEVIAAGILTTLGSLSNLFLCLMNHPDYQTKIHDELDRVIGRDRLPTIADRQECVFLEAVIIEAQRYITTVPLSIPHLCEEGIEFEGYGIPPKSLIIPNVWYAHHDQNVWGDPWTFRPERWLDENGGLLPNDHPLRKHWLAFSIGRRHCPGESLARSRLFLYVATVLQRWTLEMPPGHTVPCDPRLGHFNVDLNCRPKPYMCRARLRSKIPNGVK